MDGACAGGDEQDARFVLLQEPRFALRGTVVYRVVCEAGRLDEFFAQRKNLSQKRVVGVAAPHSGDVAPWRKESKLFGGPPCRGDERRRKFQ